MVTLFSIHSQFLQFSLILMEVQYSLWNNNICINTIVQVEQVRPSWSLLLNLHSIEHQSFVCLVSHCADVGKTHFFEIFCVFFFQKFQGVFRAQRHWTNTGAPMVVVSELFGVAFFTELVEPHIFCLRLGIPKVFFMLLSVRGNFWFQSFALIFIAKVDVAANANT